MKILVIDAQGGGVGKSLIALLKKRIPNTDILAIGTNAAATAAMLKAGADRGATGENPVKVNANSVDVIMGPLGIVIAESMLGEITPLIANSVAASSARKILIPFNQCGNEIVGLEDKKLSELIEEAVSLCEKQVR